MHHKQGAKVMANVSKKNDKVLLPGNVLKDKLKEIGFTQKKLASQLAIQASHLSEIIRGNRRITEQCAESLAKVFDEPASFWLHLQAEYDFKMKTVGSSEPSENKAQYTLSEYNELYDMKEIFKRTGLQKKSASEKVEFCKSVLHFGSITEQRQTCSGYYHRSSKTGLDSRMISTWSVMAMYAASQKQKPNGIFKRENCDELSLKLSSVFNENYDTLNRVERILSEYGVIFCVVPKVKHASIDGFSFYQDGIPTVAVTIRFDRIDNLAFAVLHEIGHLKLHLANECVGKVNIVDPDAEFLAKEEVEANVYAANALIPEHLWTSKRFEVELNPFAIQKKFSKWSREHQLNKWIVLGRLSHETGMYMFKSDVSRKIQ